MRAYVLWRKSEPGRFVYASPPDVHSGEVAHWQARGSRASSLNVGKRDAVDQASGVNLMPHYSSGG